MKRDCPLPYTFEHNLYRAVRQFKKENPGVLEARTEQRKKKEVNK